MSQRINKKDKIGRQESGQGFQTTEKQKNVGQVIRINPYIEKKECYLREVAVYKPSFYAY